MIRVANVPDGFSALTLYRQAGRDTVNTTHSLGGK